MRLEHLVTEQPNGQSANLDALGIGEALALMNREDARVASCVARALPAIASAVAAIADALRAGGRLIYIGAGNSGRIGYLDALECQPTFGTRPGDIVGIVAGGFAGINESAEDSDALGRRDLEAIGLTRNDVVVGLTASGRTPYVIGALRHARDTGCRTVCVACNVGSEAGKLSDVAIEVDCGPEVLTGSTRLKAGTAQKMICNMLSTISMVALGKTYGNLMVDVQAHNHKLRQRAIRIVSQAARVPPDAAERALEQAGNRPRIAILMLVAGIDRAGAERLAGAAGGSIRNALASLPQTGPA
ncbi:N-acetylmuramic acid 6-phosphate etherase [Burkholderia ubonensis]|uniref:N-acetylmuramic acid 6-phosphate etherase n=1 Tax=Burkholderia ubonensis TaxID=101571 RepID=UPI00075275AA|nr:N-acetylmuramic acid 6-phosphate etherase [Burkholderia ubonensis]KVN99027.1 N-acetylmuramic acid 6-phosphate etherase [Burkholderia ubonensis]